MTAKPDSTAGERHPSAQRRRGDVDPDEVRSMFFEVVSLIAQHLQDVNALARISTLAADDLVGNWSVIVGEASRLGIVVMDDFPGTHLLSGHADHGPWVMSENIPPPLPGGSPEIW